MKNNLGVVLLIMSLHISAQTDTLNKFNSKGKKQGYWVEYINENMHVVDSSNYSYKRMHAGTTDFQFNYHTGDPFNTVVKNLSFNLEIGLPMVTKMGKVRKLACNEQLHCQLM